MNIKNRFFALIAVLFCISGTVMADEVYKLQTKYPDYGYEYLGEDRFEALNRKVFIFNQRLNKYAIKPVHVLWASIMPKYGMDRIQYAYTNIEYPKRLVSTLLQKDFKAAKTETVRFLANTTIGVGGMFDPAKTVFKIEPAQEDIGQGLAKCKVKQGPYLVLPVMSSTTPRDVLGKIIECPLDPSMYIGSPITALVKLGLLVNRSSYTQPMIKMIESTFADPYDIARKLYGLERYIKNNNLDRSTVLEAAIKQYQDELKKSDTYNELTVNSENENSDNKLIVNDVIKGHASQEGTFFDDLDLTDKPLSADITLENYKPQNPMTDAMRTALFELPGVKDSIWTELSVWNRGFDKQIKTSSVSIDPSRDKYCFRYILQKDKNAPLAIIYPSVGEGVTSHHSVVLTKMFYDEGYSVVIQGSHFHWEFVKSMPKDFRPGLPADDTKYLRLVTSQIINKLEDKYNRKFNEKIVFGTSFGAFTTLFLADAEAKNNILNVSKFIAVNPPIELVYAIQKLDKNNEEWNKNPAGIKHRVALSAAKIIQLYNMKDTTKDFKLDTLPFSEDEAKLITCFVLRQKLSDLIFTLEDVQKNKKTDIYNAINNLGYIDYVNKYIMNDEYQNLEQLSADASLFAISDFLKNNDNYRIYHTLDDYFVNRDQLKKLKTYARDNIVLVDHGSHLGYLYRKEFKNLLLKDISFRQPALQR